MLILYKKIEPKNIIIYLGGNDADGQSSYGSDIGIDHYTKFLSELQYIFIGINYASSRREAEYVKNLNDYFKRIHGKKIFYIKVLKNSTLGKTIWRIKL